MAEAVDVAADDKENGDEEFVIEETLFNEGVEFSNALLIETVDGDDVVGSSGLFFEVH